MDTIKRLFAGLGLSKNSFLVYEKLFTTGPMSITKLHEKTALHRPEIYRILDELAQRKLISPTHQGKRKTYVAAPANGVRDIFATYLEEVEKVLPELQTSYRSDRTKPTITLHEGRGGITSVFADLIDSTNRGETFYRFSSERDLNRTNTYLPRDYRKKRDAKGLERFVITAPRIGKEKKVRMERAMKYIPEGFDLFDQDVIELIYADKVAFIDLASETSLIINSARLADFHKKLFRLLYQKL